MNKWSDLRCIFFPATLEETEFNCLARSFFQTQKTTFAVALKREFSQPL